MACGSESYHLQKSVTWDLLIWALQKATKGTTRRPDAMYPGNKSVTVLLWSLSFHQPVEIIITHSASLLRTKTSKCKNCKGTPGIWDSAQTHSSN